MRIYFTSLPFPEITYQVLPILSFSLFQGDPVKQLKKEK